MTKKFVYQTNKVRLDFMDKFCHFLIAPKDVVLKRLNMSVGEWRPGIGYECRR